MDNGAGEVAQIAQVTLQGVTFATQLITGGLKLLARLASMIYHAGKTKKEGKVMATSGETDLKTLSKIDPNINFHSVDVRLYEEFVKLATQAGIPLVKLDTFINAAGKEMVHVMYPQCMTPRMTGINESMLSKTIELERKAGKTNEEATNIAKELNRDETAAEYLALSGANCSKKSFDKQMKAKYPDYDAKIVPNLTIEDKKKFIQPNKEPLTDSRSVAKDMKLNEIVYKTAVMGYQGFKFDESQVIGHDKDTVEFVDTNNQNITVSLSTRDLAQTSTGSFLAALNKDSNITVRDVKTNISKKVTFKEFSKLNSMDNSAKTESASQAAKKTIGVSVPKLPMQKSKKI